MNDAAASGSGAAGKRSGAPFIPWVFAIVLVSVVAAMLLSGGGLGYRSVAEMDGKVPIGHDVERVRIEIQNGTVGVDDVIDPSDRSVQFAGGVRRAADSAEELRQIEAVPFQLVAAIDPTQPNTLVLRGPRLPAGSTGLLAYELGVRVPAELAIEVVVEVNGHVTVGHRRARVDVSTKRGDLRFEHCTGPVRAKTDRGNVIAFDHRGDLDLFTVVGDMQAFVREPGVLLRLDTGQGSVQCGVPPDCEFDLDARAEVGRIGADFGLTAETVGRYGAALVGTQGSGRTKVVLRTGSGHLSFRARKETQPSAGNPGFAIGCVIGAIFLLTCWILWRRTKSG
jgi:hypothetical protein